MGISVYEFANAIKALRSQANDIVLGRRAITTGTALRLGRYFGISPEFWINLQVRFSTSPTAPRDARSSRSLAASWSTTWTCTVSARLPAPSAWCRP